MTESNGSAVRALLDAFWEDLLEDDPIMATEVGDERFDDRLRDTSEQGVARREAMARRALADVAAIDREGLEFEDRAGLDLMEAIARRLADEVAFGLHRLGAVRHIYGPGGLLAVVGSLQRADTPERLDRYVARLSAVPAYLRGEAEAARSGMEAGQTMPALVVERTIAQVERLLAMPVEESPALAPVPEGDRDRVLTVLRDEVAHAYGEYLDLLREYLPKAREGIAVSDLPDGEAMYASQIRAYTTLPLDPQEVHDIGLREFDAIARRREEIAGRLDHANPAEAIAARTASGENTAGSREEMLEVVRAQVERSWDAAPGFFGRRPRANCEVRAVEEFRERDMPPAFYYPPSQDGGRAGIYYVNLSDLPNRPLHRMAAVTFHEANPGHHFQLSIELEFEHRAPIRRFGGILAGSAYIEGWGLYCERLAEEMGLYRDDYELLGMLEAQAWRAVRLIVDTGMHALGWTREQAIERMHAAGILSPDAEIEIDRYIAWPGQALAYKVGHVEIERWRAEAEQREGSAFSLPDFHDRLLALGSLPLPALEREIRAGTSPSD